MECGFDKTLLTGWLNGQLTETERAEVETHLDGCETCLREVTTSKHLWTLMEELPTPEPPSGTLLRFNAMLDDYKATVNNAPVHTGILTRLKQLFTIQPGFAFAYSLLLIVAGVGIGRLLNTPAAVNAAPAVAPATASGTPAAATASTAVASNNGDVSGDRKQLEELTAQVSEMREIMMKSLLQNPSASERIRGVSYTSEIKTVNPGVIDALLTTLNNDPNVNVRLMTLEALTHYAGDPAVRQGLIASILRQESPLVQAALADVMLKLQERNAVRPFKTLLQQKNLNSLVRTKIETAIARLS
jgi:hypothetical protein